MVDVTKAVILAAGRGTRMGSLTEDLPKPMLPLQGKPMLAHQIERLEEEGINEILLVTGYKGNLVKKHFECHPPTQARLHYCHQKNPDGTGSAARLAQDFTGSDDFILTFGDILVDKAVYRLLIEAMEHFDVVLSIKRVSDPYQGAAVYIAGERVTHIIEKPQRGQSKTEWVNAGVYGFRRDLFDELKRITVSPRGEYELTDAVSSMVTNGKRVGYVTIEGFWKDVGRPEDISIASHFVAPGP